MKDYFKKYTKDVSFIELKPDAHVDVNGYKVGGGTPLPILVDDLVGEVKDDNEEIKFVNMINGMIYTIGIDSDFPHAEEYKKILKAYAEDIENYMIYSAMEKMKENKVDEAMIHLRAVYALNENNVPAIYNYSIALEERAKIAYEKNDKKLGTDFLREAMVKMEEVRDKDDENNREFPLAYYKLGFYYKAFHKFIDAKDSWEKFIELTENSEEIDEVREVLQSIEDDVQYEEGYSLVLEGRPKEGVEKLLPLTKKFKNWWNLDFVIGVGFRQLGEFDKAISYFKKVLDVNPAQVDTLNEMGLCKANLGDMEAAVEFFDKAVKMNPKNHEIICNRGMAKLQLGDVEGATEDIKQAHSIAPEDEIVKSCIAVLGKAESPLS